MRLDAFLAQRGEEVFAHRSRHRRPISGSMKVRIIKRPLAAVGQSQGSQQLLILLMRTNPEPNNGVITEDTDSSPIKIHSGRI